MVLAAEYQVENPVTSARGRIQFNETATAPDRLLQDEIEAVNARLAFLEQGRKLPNESMADALQAGVKSGPGDRVFHIKFGHGLVESRIGNTLVIDFEKAGRKKVLSSFLTEA